MIPENNQHWENYLLSLTILDYLMAPKTSLDNVAFLRVLIEQHHIGFKDLYPDCSITPTFHYLIHYPEFISR